MQTLTLRPNADVIKQLVPNSGSTNYTQVDETGAGDGDVSYVFPNVRGWVRDLYGLPDHTTETEDVLAVRVYVRHRLYFWFSGDPISVRAQGYTVLKTHDVEYNGVKETLTGGYELDYTEYTVNPQTRAAWTWAEIDALNVGWAGAWESFVYPGYYGNVASYCTQVWCEVDYDKDIDVEVNVPALAVDATVPTVAFGLNSSEINVPALGLGITLPEPEAQLLSLYSPLPPMKVMSQHLSSSPERLTCSMSLVGIPDLLAEDKASTDYYHSWADPKTVKTMITEIASGVAVPGEVKEAQELVNSVVYLDADIYGYGQILPAMPKGRTLTKIAFKLRKVGSPSGDITFRIADSEFVETLASKVLGDASMVGSMSAWFEVTLDTPLVMGEANLYAIWCEYSDGDASNKIAVSKISYSVKAGEYAVQLNVVGDPTEYADVDCAYKYTYESDGINCFGHCTAYEVVYDRVDSLIDTYKPGDAFRIYEGESRLSAINKLLNYTTCLKRVEDDGKIHIFTAEYQMIPNIPGLFEYYNTGADNNTTIQGVIWKAQTFTPSISHQITSVKIQIFRTGLPGKFIVSIRATDANGKPTGEDLCASYVDGDKLMDSLPGEWKEIKFISGYYLSANKTYAIVVGSFNTDINNRIRWRYDYAGSTYTGGTAAWSPDNGVSWLLYDYDLMFEEWGLCTYEYSLTEGFHNFFAKSIRQSLVIPNRIVVHSLAEDYPQYTGSATSAASYALLPVSSFVKTRLESNAQAKLIAEAIIARMETDSQQGAAVVPMNIAAEVYDFVKVTDAIEGDSRTGNMGWLRRSYKPGPDMQSSWRMSFGFGKMTVKGYRGTSPHRLARFNRPQPPEPLNDETIVRWGVIRSILTEAIPDAFDRVWDGDEQEGYAGINDLVAEINDIHLIIQDIVSIIQQLVEGYRELTE